MPNPYVNNDKAAAFVQHYASDGMVASSVNRLYRGGIARQQQARIKAEQEAYPERYQPPLRRTQAEIEHYLQSRVETELLRRQQHRAALQRELSSETVPPPRYIEKRALQRQVKRLYTDSMRRRRMREEQMERAFGRDRSEEELVYSGLSPREIAELKEREAGWRPPSASVPHEDDSRVPLSSQYEYYADSRKFEEVYVVPRQPRPMTARERDQQMKRLTLLSMPLRVTPKRVGEVRDPNAPPPFHVQRRASCDDGL